MANLYDKFQDEREKAKSFWDSFAKSYGTAYNTAFKSFHAELKKQEQTRMKRREMMLSFAFFALSLTGGSILTQVFGKAVAKEVAGDVALDIICKNNMEKAFKVAHFVAENKTAQFAIGKLWDEAGSQITSAVKDKLKENSSAFPEIQKFANDPINVQNKLENYIEHAYRAMIDAGAKFRDNISQSDSQEALEKILKSPFISAAPRTGIDESKTRIEIELTLFMRYILELDFIQKYHYMDHGKSFKRSNLGTPRPIDKSPWSRNYPKYKVTSNGGSVRYQEINYRQIELNVEEHIEKLHKPVFNTKFFQWWYRDYWITKGEHWAEDIDRDVLKRAHTNLVALGNRNAAKIQQSLKSI
jgi:hypothetical protein